MDNSSIDKIETSLERLRHFSRFRDTTDALPCHIHLPVCFLIMDPHSRAAQKNMNHGNEVLLQDTTHLLQRPRYERGSLCQDPASNSTIRRVPDHLKETQTEVVWTCLPFIRSSQNQVVMLSEGRKYTKQREKEVGRKHQGIGRPGLRRVPGSSGEHRKMEETVCEVIIGVPTIPAIKG